MIIFGSYRLQASLNMNPTYNSFFQGSPYSFNCGSINIKIDFVKWFDGSLEGARQKRRQNITEEKLV